MSQIDLDGIQYPLRHFKRRIGREKPKGETRKLRPSFEGLEARDLPTASATVNLAGQAAAAAVKGDASAPSKGVGAWTVMVYITGDNLNDNLARNILQLENLAASLPPSVKIVVFWSQPTRQQSTPQQRAENDVFQTGDDTQTWTADTPTGVAVLQGMAHNIPDNTTNLPPIHTRFTLGNQDSGDPATLEKFMLYAAKVAPAQRYMLDLSDHGAGIDGFNFDGNFPGDNHLNVPELVSVLKDVRTQGISVSDLAFDECLMATVEVETALKTVVPYVIASEELVPGTGFTYDRALAALANQPRRVSPVRLAKDLVQSYQVDYGKPQGDESDTLSAVSTQRLCALNFGLRMISRDSSQMNSQDWSGTAQARASTATYSSDSVRDLGQFLSGLLVNVKNNRLRVDATFTLKALNRAVFDKTTDRRASTGLSIVFPSDYANLPAKYATNAASFLAKSKWDQFLQRFGAAAPALPSEEFRDWAEPNNGVKQATQLGRLEAGSYEPASFLTLPKNDVDTFSFTVAGPTSTGDTISIAGPAVATSDAAIQLFQLGGTGTAKTSNLLPLATAFGSTLALPHLETGVTYVVQVQHADNGKGFSYALKVNLSNNGQPAPVDIPSNNSTIDTATYLGSVIRAGYAAVNINGQVVKAFSRTNASQVAWYSFNTASSETPYKSKFIVEGGANQELTVILFDQSGNVLAAVNGTSSVEVPYQADGGAQPYFFAVGGDPGFYRIYLGKLSLLNG